MPSTGSVSNWIVELKASNQAVAQQLWERYFQQMMQLARQMLHGNARRAADEEDVALSAFDSFCRGAANGRFPKLDDRHDLWQVLVVITARKALDLKEHDTRQKRGGGVGVLQLPEGSGSWMEVFVGNEPSPDVAAQMTEECERLLAMLEPELRQVAIWKMEGYTCEEIAQKLGCVTRTVERRLHIIRALWRADAKQSLPS